ncbi:MAG: hypothetical protein QM493_01510 [Sulfurovum sp.]
MTILQFDDDPIMIQAIKENGLEIIKQEFKRYIKNKFILKDKKLLSDSLDKKIRMARVINREKSLKIQNAIESLGNLISDEDKKLFINEAKERYFLSKDI